MRRNFFCLLLVCTSLFVCESAISQTSLDFDGGASGTGSDWFDSQNWNPDQLPGSGDSVTINEGFGISAMATGTSVDLFRVGVGDAVWGTMPSTPQNNSLTSNIDMNLEDIYVGSMGSFATGAIEGTWNIQGSTIDHQGAHFLSVGSNNFSSSNPNRQSTGTISMDNSTLIYRRRMEVGSGSFGAIGAGTLVLSNSQITGAVGPVGTGSQMGLPEFGAGLGPGGTATIDLKSSVISNLSEFDQFSGTLDMEKSEVSVAGLARFFDTSITMNPSLITAEELSLGSTVQLEMEINGTSRVTSGNLDGLDLYSAIDVETTATLAGDLTVAFGFTPNVGDSFDLVRLETGGVMSGSFDSIVVSDPALSYQTEVVAGSGSTGDVFRLTITAVPEPASAVGVLLIGMISLGRRRKRLG